MWMKDHNLINYKFAKQLSLTKLSLDVLDLMWFLLEEITSKIFEKIKWNSRNLITWNEQDQIADYKN
jgi:hypothetical protein